MESGSEKKEENERPRFAQGRLVRSTPGVGTGRTVSHTPLERKEPGQGHFEDFDSDTLQVEHEMQRYPANVTLSIVFRKKQALIGSLRRRFEVSQIHAEFSSPFCFINNKRQANIFFTVETAKI